MSKVLTADQTKTMKDFMDLRECTEEHALALLQKFDWNYEEAFDHDVLLEWQAIKKEMRKKRSNVTMKK